MEQTLEEKKVLSKEEYSRALSSMKTGTEAMAFIMANGRQKRSESDNRTISNTVATIDSILSMSFLDAEGVGYICSRVAHTSSVYKVEIAEAVKPQTELPKERLLEYAASLLIGSCGVLRSVYESKVGHGIGSYYEAIYPLVYDAVNQRVGFLEFLRKYANRNTHLTFRLSYDTGNCGAVFVSSFSTHGPLKWEKTGKAFRTVMAQRFKDNYSLLFSTDREGGLVEMVFENYATDLGVEVQKSESVRNKNSGNPIKTLTIGI